MTKGIGIFGGTFDPVHHGHLRSAFELAQQFDLDHIRLIPSARPPHREQPQATPEQRLMMLHLAVKNSQTFVVDDCELKRQGPSYTVDTLASLRAQYPERPLFLMMGTDAFAQIDTWHHWQQLLTLSHIALIQRPEQSEALSNTMAAWYQSHLATSGDETQRAGKIWPVTLTQLNISATGIRAGIANGLSPAFLTPDPVAQLIAQLGLYR